MYSGYFLAAFLPLTSAMPSIFHLYEAIDDTECLCSCSKERRACPQSMYAKDMGDCWTCCLGRKEHGQSSLTVVTEDRLSTQLYPLRGAMLYSLRVYLLLRRVLLLYRMVPRPHGWVLCSTLPLGYVSTEKRCDL
ncbi:uncharacterized protein BDV14DRAFT_184058 [Aspergillus stella-maris]|uniref:uncharacterized protein n=1 Tax=Aspergillus stella-maris TaxID=1810926 RepID=UPI003CCD68AB